MLGGGVGRSLPDCGIPFLHERKGPRTIVWLHAGKHARSVDEWVFHTQPRFQIQHAPLLADRFFFSEGIMLSVFSWDDVADHGALNVWTDGSRGGSKDTRKRIK